MREIKFRAWNPDTKRMVYYLQSKGLTLPIIAKERELVLVANVDELEWLQYIGLRDKNNKEIYEGDLIKDSDSDFIGQVVFDTETLAFTTKFQSNELWGFVPRHGKDNHCEIIGNIYENPELQTKDTESSGQGSR